MTRFRTIGAVATALSAAALLCLLDAAPRAQAAEDALKLPPAPFKPVAVGTKLSWKNAAGDKSGVQIITEHDGYKIKFTWNGKDRSAYIACLFCTSRGAIIDEKLYATLWPLTVGKSVTIDRMSGRGSWTNKITVVGTEKLKLAFGTIDTYRVVNESKNNNTSWEGVREYWYAPSIGYIVKNKHSDNENKNYGWEVTAVTKP